MAPTFFALFSAVADVSLIGFAIGSKTDENRYIGFGLSKPIYRFLENRYIGFWICLKTKQFFVFN